VLDGGDRLAATNVRDVLLCVGLGEIVGVHICDAYAE
jgi:hypothetical protein